MKRNRFLVMRVSCLFLISLVFVGCISRHAPSVAYFSFLNMSQLGETQTMTSLSGVNLGIGPVMIPETLKRSQVVTRRDVNQYEFNEFNRWAGILEKDIAKVLGDNLDQLLGVDEIAEFPWPKYFNPTYRVIVDIEQLDGDLKKEAVLSARWAITDASGKNQLVARKSVHRTPLENADYPELVEAESQLLAILSKEIANEIVALRK